MTLSRRDALIAMAAAPLGLPFTVPSFGQSAARAELKPGDDFYRYVNAADVDAMTIPPGYWDYGQFDIVAKRVNDGIAALVRKAADERKPWSPAEQRVGAVYRSILDEAAIERTAVPRLKRELARILSAGTHEDLGRLMAHPRSSTLVAFNVFPAQGEWMVHLDQQNQNQPMLGLGGRDYESSEARAVKLREAYQAGIAQLFGLAGVPDGTRRATDVLAIEKEIARRQWQFEQLRDRRANLHIMSPGQLEAYAPGLPWREMLRARGVARVSKINLGTDSAVAAQARLFRETPVDVWRSWLAFSWIRNGIDVMPAAMREAWWRFSGEVAKGGAPRPPREEEAVQFVTNRMAMDVGRLYVQATFSEESRQRAEQLLAYLKRAMAERLRNTEWLDPASRTEALAKLKTMALKAGYPSVWPQPEAAAVKADDAAGNLDALLHRDWSQQVTRLTSAAARREPWYQSPIAVNASYSVLYNSIEVPAAILEPPFFSADADPAVNFGAIGAIIGHEMGHAYDDQGLLFDSKGFLRDWMSPEAKTAFATRAQRLVAQYGSFEPLPGLKLNGRRTLGENIADLSGLSLALRAYQLFRADQGGSGDVEGVRLLFRSWAKVWCYVGPKSAIRFIAENSYHAPAAFRVNGTVRNIDAWYDAFGVTPGDAFYLPPDQRVRLW
jgi:endothelin-converting enzyme/putative endopeptidase